MRLTYTNDYSDSNADRNVYLDRLVVRNAAGRVVAQQELEELAPSGDCNRASDDDYALWCSGSVEVPIEVPAAGSYEIALVAWAEQAGDELPRLSVFVEDAEDSGAGADTIRSKLVELYDELLGVQVTPHSPDVDSAYRIFVGALKRGQSDWFTDNWRCSVSDDIFFFEGILDNAVKEYGSEDEYYRYELDWDRVDAFMDSIDFSDPQHAARAWVSVLAYLLMDYRYLYL